MLANLSGFWYNRGEIFLRWFRLNVFYFMFRFMLSNICCTDIEAVFTYIFYLRLFWAVGAADNAKLPKVSTMSIVAPTSFVSEIWVQRMIAFD